MRRTIDVPRIRFFRVKKQLIDSSGKRQNQARRCSLEINAHNIHKKVHLFNGKKSCFIKAGAFSKGKITEQGL